MTTFLFNSDSTFYYIDVAVLILKKTNKTRVIQCNSNVRKGQRVRRQTDHVKRQRVRVSLRFVWCLG